MSNAQIADFYFMKNQFNLRSVKNKNKIKRMKHNLLLTTPSLEFPTKMAGKWCNMQSFQQKAETFDRHMGVGGFQNTPSEIPEISLTYLLRYDYTNDNYQK